MYRFRRGFGSYAPPPSNIASVLQNASASSGVPYSILQALAYQESSYNPTAVPPGCSGQNCGQGLLQVTPATGASLGLTNPFDAQANANAGAAYLMQMYQKFGNWNDALVAYNEGPGAFAQSGAYPSSAAYAQAILQNAGVLDSSSTTGPIVGPPDVFNTPGDSGLNDLSSAVSGTDPLVLGGLALGVLGLIALAA